MWYIISIMLYIIAIISGVTGWRIKNNFLQYISTISFIIAGAPLMFIGLGKLADATGDWGASIVLGIIGTSFIITVVTWLLDWFISYNNSTRNRPPISLHDFNNYVTLNPDAWEIHSYHLYNSQTGTGFSLTCWEWAILHFCKWVRIDAKTQAANNNAYEKLFEYVQRDIDIKQHQNQQQMEKSLTAITKTRQKQKEMITTYSEQIQEITKDL